MTDWTIGIPTYNRAARLSSVLESLCANQPQWNILVVNDGSTDATSKVGRHYGGVVNWIDHPVNEGFARSFETLTRNCPSRYLLLLNDDDDIDLQGCLDLTSGRPSEDWAFLSTPWPRKDGSFERNLGGNHRLRLEELGEASFHAPGIAFDVDQLQPAIALLEDASRQKLSMALVYPQVILAAWAAIHGRAHYTDIVVSREGLSLPSGIRDHSALPYWSELSRLDQALTWERILRSMDRATPDAQGRRNLRRLRRWNAQTVVARVIDRMNPSDVHGDLRQGFNLFGGLIKYFSMHLRRE